MVRVWIPPRGLRQWVLQIFLFFIVDSLQLLWWWLPLPHTTRWEGKFSHPARVYLWHVYFRWISVPAAENPWGNLRGAIALTNGFMSLEFRLMGRREISDTEGWNLGHQGDKGIWLLEGRWYLRVGWKLLLRLWFAIVSSNKRVISEVF